MHARLLFSTLVVFAAAAGAQVNPPPAPQKSFDPTGAGDTSVFAPVNWLPASGVRTGSGAPGAHYWQQRADYDLKAKLDTGAKKLMGEMTMRYTNNSPDTLRFIWMQVEQNAFREGSLNSYVFAASSRFGARNFEGGDVIERFNQVTGTAAAPIKRPLKTRVEGTMMKVDLLVPLPPGQAATFDVAWHFMIPEHGADRMGYDGALFELAQWYPRVAVYDDLRGWNTEPYLGQGEFYLDYGDYSLEITLPSGYIAIATGELQNPAEVLTPVQVARLTRARMSDTTIHIITQDELKNGNARPKTAAAWLTWKFRAKNVRDAVWAASPEYMWDASSWQGHMAYAFYRPTAIETWKDAADMSRMSIMEYSERWFTYPWPHITAVEGPISGMEYPMIAMETKSDDKYDLYNVVTHEIGHMWYPMIVGSNERMHMWQDEGFNTFINYFSEARRYPEKGDYAKRVAFDRDSAVTKFMQLGVDAPLEINPDRIRPDVLGENAYVKTAVGLSLLREEILGPAAFDDAFREYTRRWAFKHPTPQDFFRTMEDVSGRRLDYFWREWFFENPHFDQAVDTVASRMKTDPVTKKATDTMLVAVRYANRARGVLPLHVRFTFSDGSTQNFDYPAEVWSTNTTYYIRQYTFVGKKVTRIELDPDHRLVDLDRTNNVWGAGPAQ
ncbi:MAG TPA: M1 family metallopeptidase [Gemmatimonadaceae bacterium]|nr:M1 family metallopeptidase [Gemmatimonadaceae bacterium]